MIRQLSSVFLTIVFLSISQLLSARVDIIHISQQNVSCSGGNDGWVTIDSLTTTAPTGPYRISITGTAGFINVGDTIFNLSPGNYTIRVRDDGDPGQIFPTDLNVSITSPNPLLLDLVPFDATCFDVCDGQVAARARQGTAPYSFVWSNGFNELTPQFSTISALCDGTYSVTITDANGCTETNFEVVGEPAQIVANLAITDVGCFGDATGSVTAAPTGGSGNFPANNYQWSSSANTTATEGGLLAGTYTVTITDNTGCTLVEQFTVSQPATPLTVSSSKSDAFCFSLANGSITTTPAGGTPNGTPPNYTFMWSDGASTDQNRTGLAGSPAGITYSFTVTDANSCTVTGSETIFSPTELVATMSKTDALCNGSLDGTATAVASGGIAGVTTFDWSDGTNDTDNSAPFESTITGLAIGKYFVTITNVVGCTTIDSIEIDQPLPLVPNFDTQNDPSCNGGSDGQISASASGGTSPYTFDWSNGINNATSISMLASGTYTVTVEDANGCTNTLTTTLNDPIAIDPSLSKSDALCFNEASGRVTSTPINGAPPYDFNWSTGNSETGVLSDTEINLLAGNYTVTVTDANGCTSAQSIAVGQPATAVSFSSSKSDAFCFNTANGSINITPSGGTPNASAPFYTYMWSDGGSTDQNRTGLAGSPGGTVYSFTVTDGNGCTATGSETIFSPTEVIATFNSTDVSCNGGNDGTVTVTASGGINGTTTFDWSNGSPQSTDNTAPYESTISNLSQGRYFVTITNVVGCVTIDSIDITEPTPLVINRDSKVDPLCNGDMNGEITITASGGTPQYTYSWNDFSTDEDRSGLMAGVYTVTVEDANGCTQTYDTTLVDPPVLGASIDSLEDASCNGFSDGFLRAIGSGGTSPYTYAWQGGPNARSNPNLRAGTYTVTVEDANGCTISISGTVGEPAVLVASASGTDASCAGIDDGTATASETGGTSPYTYNWNPPGSQTTKSINGLAGGTYTVTVTDANGCTDEASVVIGQPSAIAITTSQTNVLCNGDATGDATANPTGGTQPYTYAWMPGGSTSQTATLLTAQTYTVTVTDNNGCSNTETVTITEPADLAASITASSDPTCNGINDGSIAVTASGGTISGNYTYLWDPDGETTAIITGKGSGTYTVTVTDDNGCTETDQVTLTAPPSVIITQDSLADVNCNGGSNGFIRVAVSGGNTPYTYSWSNPNGNSPTNGGLTAGTYTVTVEDANGCQENSQFTISEPAQALSASTVTTDIDCNGDDDGTADITVSGGTPQYTFNWPAPIGISGPNQTGLDGGTYDVTITDANACVLIESITINEPAQLVVSIVGTDVSCNGANDGTAVASSVGGTGAYTYNWTPAATGDNISALSPGNYTVTVTDANGCTDSSSVTIIEDNLLTLSLVNFQDVQCNGANDGSIEVIANGGAPSYTYAWSSGVVGNNPLNDNLAPGPYTVTVTDSKSCTATFDTTIVEPPLLTVSIIEDKQPCSGATDGQITADESGGTAPYTYAWLGTTQTSKTVTNLNSGLYRVTVTDNNGCTATDNILLTPSAPIVVLGTTSDSADCFNDPSGIAAALAIGGTGFLTYNWSNGQSGPIQNNLLAGTYTVSIVDANSCIETRTVVIEQPLLLDPSITFVDESCNGSSNGSATSTPSGGTLPYTYNWSTGDNDQSVASSTISNLVAGVYTLTLTDGNGCDSISTFTINQGSVNYTFRDSVVNESCSGLNDGYIEIKDLTGGVAPIDYNWSTGSTGPSIPNLAPGTYTVTISDANLCDTIQSFIILPGRSIVSNLNLIDASCGLNNGEASVTPTGGVAPYTFQWSTSLPPFVTGTTDTIKNLAVGSYTVTITESGNCTVVENFNIINSGKPTFLSTVADVTNCFGDTTGSIAISNITGGTTPYTFQWSNGDNGVFIDNLAAGDYTLTLNDATGCDTVTTFTITQPTQLDPLISTIDENCNGSGNGSATSTPTGGTGAYTFSWSTGLIEPGVLTSSINALNAGTYTLTVEDANGCDTITTFIINQGTVSYTFRDSVVNESCAGSNDGYIEILNLSGGTAPISYSWSTGGSGPFISNLSPGVYTVTIADAFLCDSIQSFTILQGTSINSNLTAVDASCGLSNGEAYVTPIGGTAPYTFQWSTTIPPFVTGTTDTIRNLAGGNYSITVTEAGGCSQVDAFTINSLNGLSFTPVVNSNILCFGDTTASIDIQNVSGGIAPYSFDWSDNGPDSPTRNNLGAGTYTVTISDNQSCDTVETFVITQPALLDPVISSLNSSCSGSNTAFIASNPIGGTAPYTFDWSNGAPQSTGANDTIQNLTSGTYTLTVTDNNGCDTITTINISSPASFVAAVIATDDTCLQSVGSAIVPSVTGGTAPYTYTWSGGTPSNNAVTDLIAGNYNVIIEDAIGCDTTLNFVVNNFSTITISDSIVNVSCNGNNDGQIFITNVGGVNPVTYNWDAGFLAGANPTNVPPGNYSLTVTDFAGCSEVASITVSEPDVLTVSVTSTDENCVPGNDGTANALVMGGTQPYTYDWGSGATSQFNVTGLSGGNYNVTVTDSNNCQTVEAFFVGNSATFNANIQTVDASCNGGMDGEIQIVLNGAVAPVTYQWFSGLPNSPNQVGLAEGNYLVTITDGTTCSITENIRINEDSPIEVDSIATADENCSPGNDGYGKVYASGGAPPYTYTFSGSGNQFNDSLADLSAGLYFVTIEDANMCSEISSFSIDPGDDIDVNDSIINPSCFGGANGEIWLRPSGGSGSGFSFLWDDNSTQDNRTGLTAGFYRVTITDNAVPPCTKVANLSLSSPSPIGANFVEGPESCVPGGDGRAFLTPTGGTAPYTVTSTVGTVFGTDVFDLPAGNYTVTITDGNMCTGTKNFTIGTFSPAVITSVVTDATCFGGNDGSVVINTTGGANPLTFQWSDPNLAGATNNNVVAAGTYTVTVSDRLGCEATETVVVGEGLQIQATFNNSGESCNPGGDGVANITVTAGGVAPYTYDWGAGNTSTASNSNLAAGNYTVTVIDAQGCSEAIPYTINSDAPFTLTSIVDSVSCKGLADGNITQVIAGASGTLTYDWLDITSGVEPIDRLNISAGDYFVTITDQGTGCTETMTYTVGEPDDIAISFVTTDESCNPGSDGSIVLTASGGNQGNYTYQWSGLPLPNTTDTVRNLAAGTYSVTVFDRKGCSSDTTIDVDPSPGFTITVTEIDVNCNGANNGRIRLSTTPDVTGNASYIWNDLQTIKDRGSLAPGTYDVTVTDNTTGCTATASGTITEPSAITATVTPTDESCVPGGDGSATASVSGGTTSTPGLYTYTWPQIGQTTINNVGSLSAGSYNVTIQDDNGCQLVVPFTINTVAPFTVDLDSTDISCSGENDGIVTVTTTASNPSYNWFPANSGPTINNLAQGKYIVTVTDQDNGCFVIDSITVNEPSPIVPNITTTAENCSPGNDGTATGGASGGTLGIGSDYTYEWFDGSVGPTISNLSAGTYTVIIRDDNSCPDTSSFTVGSQAPFTVNETIKNVTCNGDRDGFIDLTVRGVTGTPAFQWLDGSTANPRTNLFPGTYFVTVTDTSNGCIETQTYTVTEPSRLDVTIVSSPEDCNLSNGSATASANGGSSVSGIYTYDWFNGFQEVGINSTISGLTAGSYNITITDDSLCTRVETFVIGTAAPFTIDLDSIDINCNGDNTGSITLSSSLTNFNFNWSTGNSTDNPLTNLFAGTYTVTVTDPATSCTAIDSIVVNESSLIQANITTTPESCVPGSDGTALGAATGGAPNSNYIYDWSNGQLNANPAINLTAGNYTVTVTDALSCTVTENFTVGSVAPFTVTAVLRDVDCNGGNSGQIDLTVTGASGTVSYLWSGGNTNQDTTNLTAGTYLVTVTDGGNGCTETGSYTINEPSLIVPTIVVDDASCNPGNDGRATASATGGSSTNGIYTFEWSTGSGPVTTDTSRVFSLSAGTYTLTITDDSSCSVIQSFTVGSSAPFTVSEVVTDVSCNGLNDGAIDISISGNTGRMSYDWVGGNVRQDTSNLLAGTYTVTITDNGNGCTEVKSYTVNEPSQIVATVNKVDESCSPGGDGSANVNATGGTVAIDYAYNWSTGSTGPSISGLIGGNYDVTVTDDNNCSVVVPFSILPGNKIIPNATVVDETCSGQCDGSISLNPTGGSGVYTYAWNNGQNSQDLLNLCGGTYTVTISDGGSCDTTLSFTINSNSPLLVNITTKDQSCTNFTVCDGEAYAQVSGGLLPYTYQWSGGVPQNNPDSAFSICVGTYDLTVTDASGCVVIEPYTINGPAPITASFNIVDPTCNFTDGEVRVIAAGGSGAPYTYEWFDASLTPLGNTTDLLTGIGAGLYIVEVSDQTGCFDQFNVSVSNDGAEVVNLNSTDVSCFNSCDGTATANYVCLNPNCSIEWFELPSGNSIATNTNSLNNLCAGDYYAQVINDNNCTTIVQFTIGTPDGFILTSTQNDVSCFGGFDGNINVNAIGGTGQLTYTWAPGPISGQGTSSVSSLNAGTYTLTLSDASSCDSVFTFTINEPNELDATFSYVDASCGASDGTISASISGGTVSGNYNLQWLDALSNPISGATTATVNNLSAGTYLLRVIDDNSCQKTFTATLGSSNAPVITVDSIKNIECFGENDGALFISVSGPNTPYTYNWAPTGQAVQDINQLAAGTYTVAVTNSLGCIAFDTATVSGPSELIANITSADANCGACDGSAKINISGGTAPYTYLWSNGSAADSTDNLCAGLYTAVVTDANGCSESFDVTINNNGGPTGESVSVTAASCASNCDGSATVNPIGGTAPYTYLWLHNGATSNSLNNLCPGNYTLQITDVSGCNRLVDVDIQAPAELTAQSNIVAQSCQSNPCDGSIRVDVSGGTRPYSYNWNPSLPDSEVQNSLCAGIYNLTITDANGCSLVQNYSLGNSGNTITANPTATDATCAGSCDGSLISNVNSTIGVTFEWFNDQGQSVAPVNNNLLGAACAGDYFLEITQFPGDCKTYYNVTVGEPDSITLGSTIVNNISCNGECDGEIFISTSGGIILYSYSWNDPNNTDGIPVSGLCAGTYTVTAEDANGCSATTSVTLNDPPVLNLNVLSSTDLICSSDTNATANVDATGGVAPYTFTWSGGQTGANPTNLGFGPNDVTVEDASGCIKTETVLIGATDTVVAIVPSQTLICGGDSIQLNGTILGSSVTSFGWYEGSPSNLLTNNIDTTIFRDFGSYTFYLIASNGGCSDTTEYSVTIAPLPTIGLAPSVQIFKDEIAIFKVSGQDVSYQYAWSPNLDINDTTIAEPQASPREDRVYTLVVTDANGCQFVDSIFVDYEKDLRIPSGISPNGDGVNDTWVIEFLSEFPNAEVSIYNRWGKLIYQQDNGYTVEWDGTFEGKALPIGTYYYIIDLKNDRFEPLTGPITIIK